MVISVAMGILGLTSFVDHNQQLLTDLELHDTRLIIDGNNLYHFLYYYYHVSYEYGGDYDSYASKVKLFFDALRESNVTPYVIFDGGYERDDRKLRTTLQRARDRVLLVPHILNHGRGKMLPIMAGDVFRNVLDEMGIKHLTCVTEADSHIAALAVEWGCPVLSNDSDFFIYDISSGFVLLDYLDLNVHRKQLKCSEAETEYKYLKGQIYYMNNLTNLFRGLPRDRIPLMATIIGNDIVQSKTFEAFLSSSKLARPVPPSVVIARRHARIVRLLQWLQSVPSVEYAVEVVLNHIPQEQKLSTQALINKSLATYTQLSTDLHLCFEHAEHVPSACIQSYDGNQLPDWFAAGIRLGKIGVFLLNAVTLRRHILLTQMENIVQTSSHAASRYLRQAAYAILLSCDRSLSKVGQRVRSPNKELAFMVKEYDRDGKNQKLYMFDTTSYDTLVPSLADINSMSVDERRSVLARICKVNFSDLSEFPCDLQLVVCAMTCWLSATQPAPFLVLAVWLCVFKTAGLSKDMTDLASAQCADSSQLSLSEHLRLHCASSSIQSADCNLAKFMQPPKHNRAKPPNAAILHCYAELQSCLHAILHLYQLLQVPSSLDAMAHSMDTSTNSILMLNGTLIYNMARDFRQRKYPLLYIEELLGRSSDVSAYFTKLYNKLTAMASYGSSENISSTRIKPCVVEWEGDDIDITDMGVVDTVTEDDEKMLDEQLSDSDTDMLAEECEADVDNADNHFGHNRFQLLAN